MGSSQRNKGAAGERELAKVLNENGIYAHRGYVQFKQSDLVGIDDIHPEVKRQETTKIWEWYEQAVQEAEKRQDGSPVVFFRRNRSNWLICQSLALWMRMYKGWQTWERIKVLYNTPFTDNMAEIKKYIDEVLENE